jgi:tRNA (cmo5U34)-methyltransferase
MAVPDRFDQAEARAYDERALRLLPGYAVMQRLTRAQLTARLPERAEVLVVGAGTGAELAELAPGRPGWRFHAVDPAAPMLAVAREKAEAGGYADRVAFHTGYVTDLAPELRCDAAVMMLVSHFVPAAGGAKQALFAEIAHRLRPGGILAFADLAAPADPASQEAAVRRAAAEDSGWSESDADKMVRYMADQLYPVDGADLDRLLASAGLDSASGYFQALGYRAWLTRRV